MFDLPDVWYFIKEDAMDCKLSGSRRCRLWLPGANRIARCSTRPICILFDILADLTDRPSTIVDSNISDNLHIPVSGETWNFSGIVFVRKPSFGINSGTTVWVDNNDELQIRIVGDTVEGTC